MKKIHLQIDNNRKLWFTSDLHFGHKNVIKFCNRPFQDVNEMNEKLIENWNSVVGENDIVFILGDTFWFNDSRAIKRCFQRLKGIIYVIPGNHDNFESYHRLSDEPRVILCEDITEVFLEFADKTLYPKKICELCLSHLPLSTWPHRENGSINFFGHIHSQPDKTEGVDQDLLLHKNQCDVGTDYWNYNLVEFKTLLEKLNNDKERNLKIIDLLRYSINLAGEGSTTLFTEDDYKLASDFLKKLQKYYD